MRFGLPHLTARDGLADDMRDCFDFNQVPNSPLTFPIPEHIPQSAGIEYHYSRYAPYIGAPPIQIRTQHFARKPQGAVQH